MTLCGGFRAMCEYNFMEAILFLASIASENNVIYWKERQPEVES